MDINVLNEHAAPIFRAEITLLGMDSLDYVVRRRNILWAI
jgi:hypothetical protein